MDREVIEVLREIRDEAKATNVRLESLEGRVDETNTRLETVEGRLRFVEKGLKDGFDELSKKIDSVATRQLEAEARTTAEIVTLGQTVITVLQNHETRISALEHQR